MIYKTISGGHAKNDTDELKQVESLGFDMEGLDLLPNRTS